MATAYTIRYGRAKAALGPGVDAFVSVDTPFGGAPSAAVVEAGVGSGGGSMTDAVVDVDALETGSGREGMVSSAEDVSMVTCLVTGGDWRRV